MNEFIIWDERYRVFRKLLKIDFELGLYFCIDTVVPFEKGKLVKNIGLKDINGKSIYADCSIVEFEHKYTQRCKKENGIYTLENFHTQKTEILQGYFVWNNDELKYEINILNHDFFICLDFINSMKNFKIIDTIQENKLGLIKA